MEDMKNNEIPNGTPVEQNDEEVGKSEDQQRDNRKQKKLISGDFIQKLNWKKVLFWAGIALVVIAVLATASYFLFKGLNDQGESVSEEVISGEGITDDTTQSDKTEDLDMQEGKACPGMGENVMSFEEAQEIARESECAEEGEILDAGSCNVDTGTWWINLDAEKPGCYPACVVDIETGHAEVNWRCTGLAVETDEEQE